MEFPGVEGVNFSQRTRAEEAAGAVVAAFNNRLVTIPRSDTLLAEDLKSVRKTHTAAGNVRFEAPRDSRGHADSWVAFALALYALPRPTSGSFSYESVKKRDIDWEHMDRKPQARRVRVGPSARRLPAKGNNWSW
jgi:phage FluMu gp28-like protein